MDRYDLDEYTLDKNRGMHRQPALLDKNGNMRRQPALKLIDENQHDPVADIFGPRPSPAEIDKEINSVLRRLEQLRTAIRIQNAILFVVACSAICALIWFLVEVTA